MPDSEPLAEEARTRRRLINLAEVLGVLTVLVSGLALWNSYSERTVAEADKAEERQHAQEEAGNVVLRATPDRNGDRLSLAPADSRQTIQSQRIAFPMALGVAPVDLLADPRIEADWFRREILRATAGDGERAADREQRIPIAITTRFYFGGAPMAPDTGIYYLVYRVEGGGLFEGRKVRLRGLSRIGTRPIGDPAAAQNRIDALWVSTHPPTQRRDQDVAN